MYPNLHEVKYWENKKWMHVEFERLNIRHPLSYIINKRNDPHNLKFPFLIKEVHSCGGKGIYKIESESELSNYWNHKIDDFPVIYQQLLNMRRDLRVILVDNEIKLHYWRLNDSDEWRPTSTSRGSCVDFDTFPDQWKQYIVDVFQSLELSTGAFDIAWENDDLKTEPYFLEVSSYYMPNPKTTGKFKNLPYNDFKLNIMGKDAYYKRYFQIVSKLKMEVVKFYLRKS